MKNVVTCPACNATNKPRAVTCRVGGQRLAASRTKGGTREPVVLQRVMSGEVFSAVVVPGEGAIPLKEPPRSVLGAKSAPGKAAVPAPKVEGLTDSEVSKLLREILSLAQRGDYAQAVATADRILEERENDPKALVLKADALFRAGRRREAAEVFDDLIQIDPENAKIWLDRGRIQKAMEKFPESLESYDRAVALDETLADAWYERATVLDVLKDATEALHSLAKALSLRPDHAPATLLRVDLEKRKSTEAVRAVADEIARELEEIEGRARDRAAEPDAFDPDATPEAVFALISEPAAVPAPARPVAAEARARVKGRMYTYVEGLDEALNGGIPEGHLVVVAGPPAAMQSSLCLSIAAYNAAKERRPSLYITLQESRESFQIQAGAPGLPLADTAGLLMFLDARDLRASVPRAGDDWVDAFAAALEALRSERPFDLLVLDSLEGLEAIARFTDRRRAILRLFED